MSISAIQQPAEVQLKVVTVNKEQPVKTSNGVAASKIFTISFSYLKKAYRTKVMKVLYADNDAMYKVALHSNINAGTIIHWLQRKGKSWTILLGEQLDAKLLKAVTSAIDTLE